jgi:hypothetical protein
VAGLLDYLYDPATFSGSGGLLSRLAPSLGTIQQSQGFPQQEQQVAPMQVGNYQMPRIGNPDQFAPQQAMTPQNATPTQGQLQQPPQNGTQPQGFGGFLNAFNENLQTLGNGGSLIGALTGQQPNNQTAQFLVSRGIEPALARTIVSDPGLLRSVLPQVIGVGGQTDDIKEYQFAKREDPSLTFQKFMQQKKAVSGEFGMQPIWGTGPDGKPAVLQLGKSGEAKQSVLPPGFSLARDPIKVEGPTGTTILDPQTRQQVGFIPKDVAGKEAAEKRGQAQGTAQAALANGADIDAEETKKKIDQFISNKGFNEVFGQLDQYRPKWSHSNAGADALARYEQLTGVSFLSAYQMLKGGGAITDIEGQKAGAAMARLNRAQGEEEAKQALIDFKDAVDTGLRKLRRAANGGQEQNAPQAQAAPKRIRLNADGTIAQ